MVEAHTTNVVKFREAWVLVYFIFLSRPTPHSHSQQETRLLELEAKSWGVDAADGCSGKDFKSSS
jgi:hypothetical protein